MTSVGNVGDLQRQFWRAQKGGFGAHKAKAKLRRAMVEHKHAEAEAGLSMLVLEAASAGGNRRRDGSLTPSSMKGQSRSGSPAVAMSASSPRGSSLGPGKKRASNSSRNKLKMKMKQLNKKMLLRASDAKSVEYAAVADVSGRNLTGVQQGEMDGFTSLTYLDAGDNNIGLEELTELIALEELHLHCNQISRFNLPQGSYPNLHMLDLSFNKISYRDLGKLSCIENLKELDLTHNGLKTLPSSLSRLSSLESLVLEDNMLGNDDINTHNALNTWQRLGSLISLKAVILDGNKFSIIHSAVDMPFGESESESNEDDSGNVRRLSLEVEDAPTTHTSTRCFFPSLEFISLARNNITAESDTRGLGSMESLREVVLADNAFVRTTRRSVPMPVLDALVSRGVSVVLEAGVVRLPTWTDSEIASARSRPTTSGSTTQTATAEQGRGKEATSISVSRALGGLENALRRMAVQRAWIYDLMTGADEEGDEMVVWRARRAEMLAKRRRERREQRKKEREEASKRDTQFFITEVPDQEPESENEYELEALELGGDDDMSSAERERLARHRERGLHLSDTATAALLGPCDDPVVESILSLPSQTGSALNPDESNVRSLYSALRFALDHPVQVSLLPGDLGPSNLTESVVGRDERVLGVTIAEGDGDGMAEERIREKIRAIEQRGRDKEKEKVKTDDASVDDLIFDIRKRLASVEDNLATVVASHSTITAPTQIS